MKLGIDIDGCLANFNKAYANVLVTAEGNQRFPATYKEDFANNVVPPWIDTWDWDKKYGYTSAERQEAWRYIKESDYWFNLEPLPQAEEAIEELERLSEDHEVYFITTRPGHQAKQQTEDWLFGLGMSNPTVLIAGQDKNPILTGLGLEFLVDDRFDNIYRASSIEKLKTYMVDAPYNRGTEVSNTTRISSVMEALVQYCAK